MNRSDLRDALRKYADNDRSLKDRLANYDRAAEKAESVGALKMLKGAEASLGRWLVELIYEGGWHDAA